MWPPHFQVSDSTEERKESRLFVERKQRKHDRDAHEDFFPFVDNR